MYLEHNGRSDRLVREQTDQNTQKVNKNKSPYEYAGEIYMETCIFHLLTNSKN